MDELHEEFKICRQCHSIYKKFTQKFCGNGCEKKPPFMINNVINHEIEPREIKLKKNIQNIIRWICIPCKREYLNEEIDSENFRCMCGVINDLLPFTSKYCANESCKRENKYHNLSLEAKSCDLCGESNFLVNESTKIYIMKQQININIKNQDESWNLEKTEILNQTPTFPKNRNLPSITFTILNNNLKYIVFGENKIITMYDIIRDAPGYIPDSIYLKLLEEYPKDTVMFEISYEEESETFYLKSILNLKLFELNQQYNPKKSISVFEGGIKFLLQEGKLLELRGGFFRIHIWVY